MPKQRFACPPTLSGDETGLVKECHYPITEEGSSIGIGKPKAVFGSQNRELGIEKMCLFEENQVAVAARNSSVRLWDGASLKPVVKSVGGGKVKILAGFQDRLVTCGQDGTCEVRTWPSGEIVSAFQVGSQVEGGSLFPGEGRRLALGGKNHDLQVYDLETRQIVFKGRNVPNDSLDMEIPIWITGVACNTDGLVFTSTAYNQIRAYDLRQRRPVKDLSLNHQTDERNHHLNCIVSTPDNFSVVVGDNLGAVSIVDVLRKGMLVSQFKGPKGSIRSISIDCTTRTLACGGLDRYVRVFNLDTHRQIGRCYVKQKITSVLLGAVPFDKPTTDDDDNDEEEEDLDWGDDSSEEEEKDADSAESVDERIDEDEDEDDPLVDEEEESKAKSKPQQKQKTVQQPKRAKRL